MRGYVREDGGGLYIMWLEGDRVSVQTTVSPREGRDTAGELHAPRLQLMTTLPAALVLLLVRRQREGLTH